MVRAMVSRSDLVARLTEASGLALVVAAAGYGKSTLLHEWDAAEDRPFVHVSAGQGTLIAHITNAVRVEAVIDSRTVAGQRAAAVRR